VKVHAANQVAASTRPRIAVMMPMKGPHIAHLCGVDHPGRHFSFSSNGWLSSQLPRMTPKTSPV
jgi:hypothetical protein